MVKSPTFANTYWSYQRDGSGTPKLLGFYWRNSKTDFSSWQKPTRNVQCHEKVHSIKFQSIATPNGLIANLNGPVEGKTHDSAMFVVCWTSFNIFRSTLTETSYVPSVPTPTATSVSISRCSVNRNIQKAWNKSMREVRVSVEWLFGDVVNFFNFLDFKKKCRWQNVYYMCSNAQCPGMLVWFHYFRCPPPPPPGLLSVIKRTLLKIQ